MPTVSVVSTVLNEVQDIERLVISLMRQSLAPAEVIIVDGGSSDGTWERLQAAGAQYANLIAIRDETCRLPASPGPIARGRNQAIRVASSEVIACADAGCTYNSDWLQNLTGSILCGKADYAVGGSCMDVEHRTVWDIAAAPFLGIKLNPTAKTKSCSARSMAFRKSIWQEVGGFPEEFFFGEDTVFDLKARAVAATSFIESAKAFYQPRHTLNSALQQLASYSVSDGVSGVRKARLFRNLFRCILQMVAVLALVRTPIPLGCVLLLEMYYAFRLDWRDLRSVSLRVLGARFFFSLLVPWVVAWSHIVGLITKQNKPNRQNAVASRGAA
jgi:glycosyltransferase involved in cell wall biosynthesis